MSLELEHAVVPFLIVLTAVLHQYWENHRKLRRHRRNCPLTHPQTPPSANT